MKKIRTKLEVILMALLLLCVIIPSFQSVTRTITSTGDNYETFIRNSNGNSWTATGANIQAALNDVGNDTGTVWIPAGIFLIDSPIQPWDNTEIRGSGIYATILKTNSGYSDTDSYDTVVKIRWQNTPRNISISDITLDGNDTYRGVNAATLLNGSLQNIRLLNNGADAFSLRINCSNLFIDNIEIHTLSTNQGLYLEHLHDSVVSNILIKNGTGAGNQAIAVNTGDNITFNNIVIDDTQFGMKLVEGCSHVTLDNIVIQNVRGDGFKIQSSDYIEVNNLLVDGARGESGSGLEIDDVEHCTINNFVVKNTVAYGINLDSASGTNAFVSLENGIVQDAGTYGFYIDDANNISFTDVDIINPGAVAENNRCENSKYLSFSSCKFTDGTYGMLLQGCEFFTAIGCDFAYNSIDGIETGGGTANSYIKFVGCNFIGNVKGMDIEADNNITISSCLFKLNSGDGIECNAADSVIIRGCIMWGDPFDDNIVGSNKLVDAADNIGMSTI